MIWFYITHKTLCTPHNEIFKTDKENPALGLI